MSYAACVGCGKQIDPPSDYPHPFCTSGCMNALYARAGDGEPEAVRKVKAIMAGHTVANPSGSDDPR